METNLVSHSISLDDRKSVNLTGINEVMSFDEATVTVKSIMGKVTIKGDKLHVVSFDENSGVLNVTGIIDAVVYANDSASGGGFLARLFR